VTDADRGGADSATESLLAFMVQLCDVQAGRGFHRRAPGVTALVTGGRIAMWNCLVVHGERADRGTVADLLAGVQATGLPHCVQTRPHVPDPVLTELVLHGMAVRMELSLMLRQDPLPPDIP
jgi:hypothetical protein